MLIDGLPSLAMYRKGKKKRFHLANPRKHRKRLTKKVVAYLMPQNCLGK
jgi:hypothetical protein